MSANEKPGGETGSQRFYPARISITGVSATPFRLPFRAPFQSSWGAIHHREGFVVRLVTDAGVIGLGEASPHPALGQGACRDVENALEQVAPRAIGATLSTDAETTARCEADCRMASEPRDGMTVDEWVEGFGRNMPPALACALDVAASDALARTQGLSLALLFGERIRMDIPVNATIGAGTPDDVAARAERAMTDGFRCVKLKVGSARTPDEERERVAMAREVLGPDVRLRLDANGAWSESHAPSFIRALEAYDIEFIEQPIPPGNLEGLRRLRQAVGMDIAADEDVTSLDTAREVLDLEAASVLVLKPMVLGGLRRARRIAELAAERGVAVVVTTTIDSGIGTAAALHLAVTLPESGLASGLATGGLLDADIAEPKLVVSDGEMELPAGPGLGVTLDETKLQQVALGPTRCWRKD